MNQLIEIKRGVNFPLDTLKDYLPDVETALFFAKLYQLDARDLGNLLYQLFGCDDLVSALVGETGIHSTELQDYIIGFDEIVPMVQQGDITFSEEAQPYGVILPELWKSLEVEVAASIQTVAEKLKTVVGHLPGKQGKMLFKSMQVMNAKRPIIGDHKAYIHHAPQRPNLVILDVSGSMTEVTVRTIVEDVVALSFMADAHLAIVSNTTTHWQPGEYGINAVLAASEYSGTHYETLAPLFQGHDWGVVVTIADYDSSPYAKSALAKCSARIDQLLDISLVSRPTYLSEVVGQLADEVRPLLIAADNYCCR